MEKNMSHQSKLEMTRFMQFNSIQKNMLMNGNLMLILITQDLQLQLLIILLISLSVKLERIQDISQVIRKKKKLLFIIIIQSKYPRAL
jgi:hypothetical protein